MTEHCPCCGCELLTVPDLAEAAGVTVATINSLRARGYVAEPTTMIGRTPVWTREDVDAWLASRPGKGGRPRKNPPSD